jgi:hypothetical protein
VSVFKLETGKKGMRTAVAKPRPAIAHQAPATLRDEKRLSGHPKERKPVKAKENADDGDWKEF